ncbi:MAG: bifunctional 23S rRNA (guanine(2069)-N(7))-methyltransferase RlmK/23S rRNA (guanine(2445)-N(2))-methyltransferase RlmL [Hahellaceae bacterium]|nr:bifunctional 23S rRNA (guanine(2069)-N(7))-methyltransferase RlmK/23S rRNA (guanine(2445)-N(2))-methyltransferase RlmL [Hahellaceae bacterium]
MTEDISGTTFVLTCPKGLETLLADEVKSLVGVECKVGVAAVTAVLNIDAAYRLLMWSRLANRLLLVLSEGKIADADALYQLAKAVDWSGHMTNKSSFLVDFSGESKEIRHTNFGAVKVKDAIVDYFRDQTGVRPDVSRDDPDLRVNVRLHKGVATIGIDLSGGSLHKRGYRTEAGIAPLKENLAAALLYRCGWPGDYADTASLVDPMCGSGTLLIEGALMAVDKAPGLDRKVYGFTRWKQHKPAVWAGLVQEAKARWAIGMSRCKYTFTGFDADPRVIQTASQNIRRAGVDDLVHVKAQALAEFSAPESESKGLFICNPPYGERIGDVDNLKSLYRCLGDTMRAKLDGWKGAIFTGNPELGRSMGVRSYKQYRLFNGTIPSQLLLFNVCTEAHVNEPKKEGAENSLANIRLRVVNAERAQMFANRLKKNVKQLGKWARKQEVECYRVYDADMPEFSIAIDCYADWIHVQEYAAPITVDENEAKARLHEALSVMPEILGVDASRIIVKQRRRQKGLAQYEKQSTVGQRLVVHENGCKVYVNLTDFLDTGLFLDHRPIRAWIQNASKGKKFLNLFCYTGVVTLNAIKGGAVASTSVDMSKTYLDWARDNLALNGFDEKNHAFVQMDCMRWLDEALGESEVKAEPASPYRSKQKNGSSARPAVGKKIPKYDLIFLDPPTFSNSKRMEGVLDIQRDHAGMITKVMKLLDAKGVLIFSNNHRKFKLDPELHVDFQIEDISDKTIDQDFQRNQKIHRCWSIRHKA